jgi:hypothetical protein
MKIHNKLPIRLDKIYMQRKKLVIEYSEGGDEDNDDYSCSAEFEAIKVCLNSNIINIYY